MFRRGLNRNGLCPAKPGCSQRRGSIGMTQQKHRPRAVFLLAMRREEKLQFVHKLDKVY